LEVSTLKKVEELNEEGEDASRAWREEQILRSWRVEF
jgi:hypothetical protein